VIGVRRVAPRIRHGVVISTTADWRARAVPAALHAAHTPGADPYP
jgi:hypothetical protein